MPDGTVLDLVRATSLLRCGSEAGCTDADLVAATSERPWGPSNPRWQLYAYGPLRTVLGVEEASPAYVLAWVADDPWDDDGDPLRDGAAAGNPGRGRILVTARAYGAAGAARTIQVTLVRAGSRVRMVTWREVR